MYKSTFLKGQGQCQGQRSHIRIISKVRDNTDILGFVIVDLGTEMFDLEPWVTLKIWLDFQWFPKEFNIMHCNAFPWP